MSTDEPPAAKPEVEADLIEEMKGIVELLPGHPLQEDLVARLDYIVDLLIMRGHLKPAHRRLLNKVRGDKTTVFLSLYPDKRQIEGNDIDCPNLIHLCKARCCSFSVALSPQDVEERALEWELYEPYRLKRDRTTGYCRYIRADASCAVYHDRPATCRLYDCRDDRRVWLDWEKKIPAPMERAPAGVIPLGEWPSQVEQPGGEPAGMPLIDATPGEPGTD